MGFASAIRPKSLRTRGHNFLSHLRLSSLFVASYDSQGYGGVILSQVHMDVYLCLSAVNLSFLDRSLYFFFHLSTGGRVDPVPDTLLSRKSGSAGNRTLDLWVCSQES
jgi:hypothetical protein